MNFTYVGVFYLITLKKYKKEKKAVRYEYKELSKLFISFG